MRAYLNESNSIACSAHVVAAQRSSLGYLTLIELAQLKTEKLIPLPFGEKRTEHQMMLRSLDWFPGRVLLSRAAYGHSTIGAEGLNCRVRDGNGCCPLAMATGKSAAHTLRTDELFR
jgi:hypothetical protein